METLGVLGSGRGDPGARSQAILQPLIAKDLDLSNLIMRPTGGSFPPGFLGQGKGFRILGGLKQMPREIIEGN